MLRNSLYTLNNIENEGEGHYIVSAMLDPHHKIFSGHFPQQPVLPGVCLLDMLKEIIREITGLPYRLAEGNNIKYLRPVDPQHNPQIRFEISLKTFEGVVTATANSYLSDGEVNFKFKGLFSLTL